MNLGKHKAVAGLISRLKQEGKEGPVKVEGTWGSFAPFLAAHISEETKRPILYIRPHIDDADKAADDLLTFSKNKVDTFPAWEEEQTFTDAADEIGSQRLKICLKLLSGENEFIISTSIQALCQPVPKSDAIISKSLQLETNNELSPETIVKWLFDNGYENVDKVDVPGQFCRRGGIIDIYAPVTEEKGDSKGKTKKYDAQKENAVRLEFFGDIIESIRTIDLDTHRSAGRVEKINIFSSSWGTVPQNSELLLNILPEQTIVILEEPADIEETAGVYLDRVEDSSNLFKWLDIYKGLERFTNLYICRFGTGDEDFIKLDVKSIQQYQHKASSSWTGHKEALEQLLKESKEGKKVYLYCESEAEISRVGEIIGQINTEIPKNLKLIKGFINQGFEISSLKTIVMTHHELFGQFTLRRIQRPMRPSAPIESLEDLQPGDYVVHVSYGIGKFLGVQTIEEDGSRNEYLTIEYADEQKIHVSVNNILLLQKFIGTSPKRPKLSKVGTKKWLRQKEKVANSVCDLAEELLEIQAKRQMMGGFAFGKDSNWQREMEEAFPYQETADQITTMEQIKQDMQQPIAMDRLLCGDVGYGKTELAMRAAFKAVENGKQVVVLVPTTVLCVQHGRTFTERFADFPVSIEVLNRFKTISEAADIIERTKQGKVDILIGTHRILSGDVGFKDLGLVIIDEEQRFGVAHKEKLKKLSRQVGIDVLTMTATPIPRTLHMSLLGLRDISSLATPPLDRRSIATTVTGYRQQTIKQAIIRELNRSGQVFFLHNRVKSIDKKAWEIKKLLEDTDAKIAVAHGQMHKAELENTMIDFVEGKIDVLVCTTIIESGLDIPNANTIIIDNSDRFGLAELHQLRGRVGRYKHRAFAYILLPASRPITPTAARRLKAIEEYSHLGAGFRIALRDMEIRGAGNILGPEQSGHIQMVGYQMYCQLLAEAVKRIKNEPVEKPLAAVLDLKTAAYIPKNYIPMERSRMEAYRKIAAARSGRQLQEISNELSDIYGPVPEEVKELLQIAELRIAADNIGIKSIVAGESSLEFSFADDKLLKNKNIFERVGCKTTVTNDGTVYVHLPKNYFEPKTLLSVLRKILKVA